ncbi:MAG: GNAT family N-acetyltransferase [Elusimicrobiota bacterium]
MINYELAEEYKEGTIKDLLVRSYAELLEFDPEHWEPEKKKWVAFDAAIYANPDTVGQCVFVMLNDWKIIGFASYDPRQKPVAIIGHNCILPEFRGKGFGAMQMNELLEKVKKLGFKKAEVTTNENPFFEPAKKMYLKCGFFLSDMIIGGPEGKYKMIKLVKDL